MMGKKIMLLKLCGKYWLVRGKVKTAELVTAQKMSIFGALFWSAFFVFSPNAGEYAPE